MCCVLIERDWQLFLQLSLKEVLTGRQKTDVDMMFHITIFFQYHEYTLFSVTQSHRSYVWELCFVEAPRIHPDWFMRRRASTSKETKWSRAYITWYISLICMVVHWWFCYVLYLCHDFNCTTVQVKHVSTAWGWSYTARCQRAIFLKLVHMFYIDVGVPNQLTMLGIIFAQRIPNINCYVLKLT